MNHILLYLQLKYLLYKASNWTEENMWIGYSDEEVEGKWVSHNNLDPVSTHWGENNHSKEPNGGRRSNCAVLGYGGFIDWDDQPCTNTDRYTFTNPFACQLPGFFRQLFEKNFISNLRHRGNISKRVYIEIILHKCQRKRTFQECCIFQLYNARRYKTNIVAEKYPICKARYSTPGETLSRQKNLKKSAR